MSNYKEEIDYLNTVGLLPYSDYIPLVRFTTGYENSIQLATGSAFLLLYPAANVVFSCHHLMKTLWATLRAVANCFMLNPKSGLDALCDAGFHAGLSLALAGMAFVHVVTYSVELLSRTVAAWFSGSERTNTLSELTLAEAYAGQYQRQEQRIPSSAYVASSRFFSAYQGGVSVLKQCAAPVVMVAETGYHCLEQALRAVLSVFDCLIHLVLCKPQHAIEHVRDLSIHLSLSLILAFMIPINAAVETLVIITRLATTIASGCAAQPVDESDDDALLLLFDYEYQL